MKEGHKNKEIEREAETNKDLNVILLSQRIAVAKSTGLLVKIIGRTATNTTDTI